MPVPPRSGTHGRSAVLDCFQETRNLRMEPFRRRELHYRCLLFGGGRVWDIPGNDR
jgi:hypothetical protein